jgi:hypothetical protein
MLLRLAASVSIPILLPTTHGRGVKFYLVPEPWVPVGGSFGTGVKEATIAFCITECSLGEFW